MKILSALSLLLIAQFAHAESGNGRFYLGEAQSIQKCGQSAGYYQYMWAHFGPGTDHYGNQILSLNACFASDRIINTPPNVPETAFYHYSSYIKKEISRRECLDNHLATKKLFDCKLAATLSGVKINCDSVDLLSLEEAVALRDEIDSLDCVDHVVGPYREDGAVLAATEDLAPL